MEVHVFRGRVLDVVPHSPADLWDMLHHALQVLAQEPRMRWAGLALIAAGLALALSRRRVSTLVSVLVVAVTGFVWLQISHVREGDILVQLSAGHGITEADLLVPLVLVLASSGWLFRQLRARRNYAYSCPEGSSS